MMRFLLKAGTALAWPGASVCVALLVRLVVALLTTGADYDIASYHFQAASVLQHRNVYLFTDRYPYPPLWVWLVALAQLGANASGLPFVWLVKLPAIVGDGLSVALLRRAKGAPAAWFYALNPVAILITAGHGQFDGLVLALVLLCWVWLRAEWRGHVAAAALALGGAIALKGYPILFLPAFLLALPQREQRLVNKQRLLAALLALLPLALAFLVYGAIFGFVREMFTAILLYSSSPYFGWSFLVAFWLKIFSPASIALVLTPLGVVARVALVAFACWLPWWRRAWPVEWVWLVTLLGFYALAPGISVQYLLWAVPLFALVDLRLGWTYTLFATLVAAFYYLTLFPCALPWGLALAASAPLPLWLVCYLVTNAGWWVVCLRMFWRALRGQLVPVERHKWQSVAGSRL